MASKFSCGYASRLSDLLDDRLTSGEQAEMTAHLEACQTCRHAFDALAGGSRWWSELRAFLPRESQPAAGQPPTAPTGTARIVRAGDTTQVEARPLDDGLDFLGPALDPGHLGRFGPYEVTELLGRGGMGVVLKAFDPTLHRPVAVKVLAPQLATSASARKRFLREARAAASVVHEHVVTIHAVDEAGGLPYLVMQYVPGRSLQERIEATGPLGLMEILRIGMQAASGLAAAHAQGLVHRDIKPANILLENGVERVKLTDFGLARAADDASLTQSGVVAGTPQYMAPEQARGEPVDHRADLFSLGSVLYAMSTGRSPFRAETTVAMLRRVCDESARPVREINPEVPELLEALIARLHSKDPAARPQTAAEVAEQLGRLLAQLQQPSHLGPNHPLPDDPDIPPAKAARRGRSGLAAAALLAVLFGGLTLAEATGVAKVSDLLTTMLRIPTRDGTLVIEVNDPGVRVDLDGDDVSIRGAGVKVLRLRPGAHQLRASRGGVALSDRTVVITRGDKQVVKMGLEPDRPAPARDREARPGTGSGATLVPGGGPARGGDDVAADGPSGGKVAAAPVAAVELRRFEGHKAWVQGISLSPDGLRVASCGGDNTIRVWELATGRLLHTLRGHTTPVTAVTFLPGGRRILSCGWDATLRLWDAEAGEELPPFASDPEPIWDLAISPDGRQVLTASDEMFLRLREVESREPVRRFEGHVDYVKAVAFSADGRRALSGGGDKTARLWDVATGKELMRLEGFGREVRCLAFSPDGGRALTGSYDGSVRLWDLGDGREVRRFEGHRGTVDTVAFSPDGRRAFSAGGAEIQAASFSPGKDTAVRVWDVATGRELLRFGAMSGPGVTNKIVIAADGRSAFTGGTDRVLRHWQLPDPDGPEAAPAPPAR